MKKSVLFFLMLFLFASCDEELNDSQSLNKYVNRWLYDNMSMLYYWNTKLPAYKSSTESPDKYFETLIYEEDRFSAIFDSYTEILNSLHGVSEADPGFEFQLYRESETNDNVVGAVLYSKPGTTAAAAGATRGKFFRKINGTQITIANYSNLIEAFTDGSASFSMTFSEPLNGQWQDGATITVTKVKNYQENPVYLDTVYVVDNKKIGYLVYNFFSNDTGDETLKYDLEMNEVFGRFKQEGISELIVDLRYNSGGMMSSAVHMGSMLVPDLAANKVFSYTEYNRNYTNYFNSDEFKKQNAGDPFVDYFATNIAVSKPAATIPVQNVGNQLNRIYFLTGRRTASASEMVINSLKPYISCILIGDVTVGKNVGSTLVNDEENDKNDWAFMPIILKYFNKDRKSDFTNGFVPDFSVDDTYNYALGDLRESLLNKAVLQITGKASLAPSVKKTPLKLTSPVDVKPFGRLIVNKPVLNSFVKQ